MKIIITGASGLVGTELRRFWESRGHTVYGVSRYPDRTNPYSLGYDDRAPEVDCIVNLAGELVVGYWTAAKKERILQSRLRATKWAVEQVRAMSHRPVRFISASAIGIYGNHDELIIDEGTSHDRDHQFLSQVCEAWERQADEAIGGGVEVTKIRIGNIFTWKKQFLGALYPFWRCGIFPRFSSPQCWLSWISLYDLVKLIDWTAHLDSPPRIINAVGPNPLQWSEFEKIVRARFPIVMTIPLDRLSMRRWMGEMADAMQDSQRIISRTAEERGFEFRYPTLEKFFAESF